MNLINSHKKTEATKGDSGINNKFSDIPIIPFAF